MELYGSELSQPFNILENTFWWWEGIVAPRNFWSTNSQEEGLSSVQQLENWGKRVKVRIQGVHPPSKKILPDDKLPWAEMRMGSVGSGHKGTGLAIGVTQGTRVYGIWENPLTKSGPIILGTLANNEDTPLPKEQPISDGFASYSGYRPEDTVSGRDMPLSQGQPRESILNPNIWGLSDKWMMDEPAFGIASPTDCEKIPLGSITKSMRALIQNIEKAQNQMQLWENAAQGWVSQKQEWIRLKVQKATEFISKGLKSVFKEIRKATEEQINKKVKKVYELINPPDRDKAKLGHDALMELITCLFNKITGNLKYLIGNFLGKMLDRYINVPACAVQNFVASLIGNTLGAVSKTIDKAISSVSSLIGGAFSLADSILNLIKAIAGFFACEEDQECPETTEWSIFDGAKPKLSFDLDSILNGAKQVANQAKGVIDDGRDLIDTASAAVDFSNLINTAVNSANSCNIGPIFCGPPTVTFWGGGGSGAKGNAIISASGDLLGVDLIAGGTGYTKAPFVTIEDSCGKGSGANAIAIMRKEPRGSTGGGTDDGTDDGTGGGTDDGTGAGDSGITTTTNLSNNNIADNVISTSGVSGDSIGGINYTGEETYTVIAVVIEDSGSGYLASPNGDVGGDGRVWAPKDNTIIKTEDGRWEQYLPGAALPERDGDLIITPEDKLVLNGSGSENLIGPGNNVASGTGQGYNDLPDNLTYDEEVAAIKGITSIPGTGVNGSTDFNSFPTINVGSYPTKLYLCDVYIKNRGINYSPGDKVVIEPNFGAEIEVEYGPFGVVDRLKIVNSGSGFTETPIIYIQSETGYNAKLYPIFCVSSVGDGDSDGLGSDQRELTDDEKEGLITVVDCVGKFN